MSRSQTERRGPRRVVVTGAAGGLGAALCAELRARGWEVVATDVRGAERTLDVTDAAACRALAAEVAPDAWVNNAGVLGAGAAVDQPDAEVERVVRVNLLGVIHGSRAAAQVMRARGGGHILNVGSLASWFAPAGEAVYAASKHGVRAFTVALAAELHGTGVDVSLLCPDGIATPMLAGREKDPHAAMSFTAGRLLDAREVARAGADLLDRPRLMATVPALKGVTARLVGALPLANVHATRLLARIGRFHQARLSSKEDPR
jgi:NAD(P)-dependent dehydrogenase (short-subunit alcohol dehydrogenase family)